MVFAVSADEETLLREDVDTADDDIISMLNNSIKVTYML